MGHKGQIYERKGRERDPRRANSTTEGIYYQDWFINPHDTRDSIYERALFPTAFPFRRSPGTANGVVGTIDAVVDIDMHTYCSSNERISLLESIRLS